MSTRKKPLPPVNISQLARDHGTSRETIRKLRENGISLADDKAVAAGLACSRAKSTPPAPTGGGETFAEAKRRRAVADADRAEVIARRESGEVIEVADVEELVTRLGAEMRSRLLSWIGTLPPMLEGLDASRIQPIMRHKITELLTAIHENSPNSKP
jgi:phage terminase Nu1 subunit (DNA packaging protein)